MLFKSISEEWVREMKLIRTLGTRPIPTLIIPPERNWMRSSEMCCIADITFSGNEWKEAEEEAEEEEKNESILEIVSR